MRIGVYASALLLLVVVQALAQPGNHYQCPLLLVNKADVILSGKEDHTAQLQLHVTNHHDQDVRILAVYTPIAERAQLTRRSASDTPWPAEGVAIGRHTTRKFENNTAFELEGINYSAQNQDPVPIVLLCDDGSHKLVKARVQITDQCGDQACD